MRLSWIATIALGVTVCGAAMADHDSKMMNRFGGAVYEGAPALEVTASLVEAGGGAENFSVGKAVTAMIGAEAAQKELAKLTKQYGQEKITKFAEIATFAIKDAARIATEAGVTLPKGTLTGKELAKALVMAGLDSHHTFWTCSMLDHAVSHKIHVAVMEDIDREFGADWDATYHMISNQANYDLGRAIGMKDVRLASYH